MPTELEKLTGWRVVDDKNLSPGTVLLAPCWPPPLFADENAMRKWLGRCVLLTDVPPKEPSPSERPKIGGEVKS